jgi:formylglycine-generating enzyme required for sulfatase activity
MASKTGFPSLLGRLGLVCSLTGMFVGTPLADTRLEIQTGPLLKVTGAVGTTNQIQYVTTLDPTNHWIALTNLVLSNSPCWLADISAAGAAQRFYRAEILTGSNQVNPPNPDPSHWVWIVPGTFMMGSPTNEPDRLPDEVQHPVTISQGFWMGKSEVTQAEYWAVMGNNPSQFTGYAKLPVEQVTWPNATNYCGKLTEKERSAGSLPTGYAYRLPTEAEWEYCCRAGTTTATAFGNGLSSTQANFNGDNSYGGAAPGPNLAKTEVVASYAPNAWGLYDLHGNVWEWCSDWYGLFPTGSAVDPKGSVTGTLRICRGGSWDFDGWGCRSAHRGCLAPGLGFSNIGFRPVLAPELP